MIYYGINLKSERIMRGYIRPHNSMIIKTKSSLVSDYFNMRIPRRHSSHYTKAILSTSYPCCRYPLKPV
jgi:hypothetical protein